ncbi:Carbonyl reductase [NADPH] 2 [Linum perenne]
MQSLVEAREEELKKTVKVNLMTPLFLLKAVGSRMRDHGTGGSIVFLSSMIGAERTLYPGSAAYASCSAAIHQLDRSSAIDVGKHTIRVNSIARGLHIEDRRSDEANERSSSAQYMVRCRQ